MFVCCIWAPADVEKIFFTFHIYYFIFTHFVFSIQFPVSFHTAWQLVTVTVTNDLPGPQNWIKIQLEGLFSSHCPAAGSLSLAVWQIDWWSSHQLRAYTIPENYIFSVASWPTPTACLPRARPAQSDTNLCQGRLSSEALAILSFCRYLKNSLFFSFTFTCSLSNPNSKRDL